MAYNVANPNHQLSPFSGMDRNHYIELGKYILSRTFSKVTSTDQPLAFSPTTRKSYPKPNDPPWRHRSNEFETLERSFTIASALIHVDPKVEINGIILQEYYRKQFFLALTPGNPTSLPMPEDLEDATYQFTCEFGGLCKTLLLYPNVLWPLYSKEEQDVIAETISKWAHHRTTQNNWRIFNILALSFLKKQGYEINDELLKSHLLWIVSYHSGNGWYLEQTYNYYTISLFVVYCTIWSRTFGDEFYPEIADVIEDSSIKLMESYTRFFGKDGYINMWARSITYRTWISGGFTVAFMLKNGSPLDPGFSRRLCSGSLLQFVTKELFFDNNIPSLGFYGTKEYMVQNYSCPGSPFLMFLPFIALSLPETSPFWTAVENEGFWSEIHDRTHIEVLEKPGIVLANYGKNGTSEIIPGKVYYKDSNYSKLAYNTHFPWEDHNREGGTAMEYSMRSLDPRDIRGDDINFYLTGQKLDNSHMGTSEYTTSESMVYNGFKDNVLYRQAIMRKPPNNGVGYIIDLADIFLPYGILRVDRSRLAFEYELTLGHYGIPNLDGVPGEVDTFSTSLGQGISVKGKDRQIALITYTGWDNLYSKVHREMNA
jgi:hypothetical protein